MDLYLRHYVAAILFINVQKCCEAAILGGLGIAGAGLAIGSAVHWGQCLFKECCTSKWTEPVSKNKADIIDIFKKNLFGQHLVMQIVPNAIHNHLIDKNPQKALVMSFHGWTGCGKNFVTHLIAKYIYRQYREEEESKYVHIKIASEHYSDPNKIEEYKVELRNFVKEKTKVCGRSLFIFDEMDKMPSGLANVIKNYIDYYPKIDGIDYRKNIFIFLNNIGGDEISDVTLQNFRDGNARHEIKSSTMEKILSLVALKLKGGFQSSELILSGLVDFFVPFLPLEESHVKECASVDIQRRLNASDPKVTMDEKKQKEIVDKAVNEIQFYPKGEDIFANTGCKHVTKKIDMFF